MKAKNIILSFVAAWICFGCAQQNEFTGGNADEFVAGFETNLEKYETAYRLKLWEYKDDMASDSLKLYRQILDNFLADPNVTKNIEHFRMSSKDEVLERKMDIIYARSMVEQIETDPDVAALNDSLDLILHKADRASHRNDYIYDIGRDLLRAEYLVTQNSGDRYGDMLLSLIRKRNIAAKRLGYNSYYSLVLKTEDVSADYIDSLCQLLLVKTDSVFKAHLNRSNSPEAKNPGLFSYRPGVRNTIAVSLDRDNQNRIVHEACKSAGFDIDKMPIYYFFADSGVTGPTRTYIIHVPDDIRIEAATYLSPGSLEGLLENTGVALYATLIDQKDYLFRQPTSTVWEEAIRNVFDRFMFEPEFLKTYLGTSEQGLKNWRDFYDYYLLIKLRYRIFCTMLEKELYTGSVDNVEKLFSDLYNKIFYDMTPPDMKARLMALYDAGHPVDAHNKLLGLLVAGQVYHNMKATNGKVLDNPATRQYLTQNCLRYGDRYDWRELLKWATGEDLKFEYYIDFSD